MIATDEPGDVMGVAYRDVVGTVAAPAVLVASTTDDLFVRLRLDGNPQAMDGGLHNFRWGVAFDTDGDVQTWEFGLFVEGSPQGDAVSLWANDVTVPDDVDDVAEREIETLTPPGDFWHVALASTTTNGDEDYFLTIGVPWSKIEQNGAARDDLSFWAGGSKDPGALDGDLPCENPLPTKATFSGTVLRTSESTSPGDMGDDGATDVGGENDLGGDPDVGAGERDAGGGPQGEPDGGLGCFGPECDPFADAFVRGGGCATGHGRTSWLLVVVFGSALFRRRRR